MNCEKFLEFTDYDGTRISHSKKYIQYARTQNKKCTFRRRSVPVWKTKISQLTKCCTNVDNLMRLHDNETFFLGNNFIMISTEIGCKCVHKSVIYIKTY